MNDFSSVFFEVGLRTALPEAAQPAPAPAPEGRADELQRTVVAQQRELRDLTAQL